MYIYVSENSFHWHQVLSSEADEPSPGAVLGIEECRLWAELWMDDGAAFFHYNSTSEECHLYCTLDADCQWVGVDKPARLSFSFSFSICQAQQKWKQILRRQCYLGRWTQGCSFFWTMHCHGINFILRTDNWYDHDGGWVGSQNFSNMDLGQGQVHAWLFSWVYGHDVNIGLVMNSYDTLLSQVVISQSNMVQSKQCWFTKNIRPKLHFNEFHSKSNNIITQVPGLPLHLQPLQPPQQLPHQPKQQVW